MSEVAHLLREHTHVGPESGWLQVGYQGGTFRTIALLEQARRPLFAYLQHGARDPDSLYVFTSQRNQRPSRSPSTYAPSVFGRPSGYHSLKDPCLTPAS